MNPTDIIALLNLAAALEPAAQSVITNLINVFQTAGTATTVADQMNQLIALQGGLKPMAAKTDTIEPVAEPLPALDPSLQP